MIPNRVSMALASYSSRARVSGEVVKDLLQHRGPLHHGGVLGQEAHLDVGVQGHRPRSGDLLPRQHPEESGSSPCR